jgi:outer membrane immunogenic protein
MDFRWHIRGARMTFFQRFAAYAILILAAAVTSTSIARAGDGYPPYAPFSSASCGGAFQGFYGGVVGGLAGVNSDDSVGGVSGLKDNDKSFTVGGVAGYNRHCGNWLYGVETDFNYIDSSTTTGVLCAACGDGGTPGSVTFGSELNWYGTVRGRLGIVGGENFLIFATGGLAYAGVDHSIDSNNFPSNTGDPITSSSTKHDTRFGYTVGGGLEYLLSERWSFRADAMYIDLGSETETFTATAADGCGGVTCTSRPSYDDSFWVARVGVTYLFPAWAPEPVVAGPLK